MMNKILLIIAGLIVAAGLTIGAPKVISTIRGIRNNNPLNIRLGESWQGLSPTQTDKSFAQFISPEYGIRAGAKNLMTYASRGVNTIEKIISTWAPPNENDTEAYIKSVVSQTGFSRTKTISKSAGDYLPLIKAIIRHENGINPYSDETIAAGIALA